MNTNSAHHTADDATIHFSDYKIICVVLDSLLLALTAVVYGHINNTTQTYIAIFAFLH